MMSKILTYDRRNHLEDYSNLMNSNIQNLSERVKQRCKDFANLPASELPDDIRETLEIFDSVRKEYNLELDMLRDKYEIKFKTLLAILANELERS